MAVCQECPNEIYAKGLCRNHYLSKRRRTETGKLSRDEKLAGISGVILDTFNSLISDEEARVQIDKLRFGSVL